MGFYIFSGQEGFILCFFVRNGEDEMAVSYLLQSQHKYDLICLLDCRLLPVFLCNLSIASLFHFMISCHSRYGKLLWHIVGAGVVSKVAGINRVTVLI